MRKTIFIAIIVFLLLPLVFSIIKIDIIKRVDYPLFGLFSVPEKPVISIPNILNGNFQNDFEKYFSYELAGRSTMSRIYNQIMYSIFNSTNTTVIGNITLIGKDGYLFEFVYIEAYLDEPTEKEKHDLYNRILILSSLQEALKKMGKHLFVIITPSKASIYPEYLPNGYAAYGVMKNYGDYSPNFYEYFVSQADGIGLKYFDYHDIFLNLKKGGMDIFPKGGAHWNGLAVVEYFNNFIGVINKECKDKIGTIEKIKANPVWGDAFMEDDDLEALLNLLSTDKKIEKIFPRLAKLDSAYNHIFPRNQYYSYHMETLSRPTAYRPNVFAIGGSFNWTWLSMVYGVKDWVEHGEEAVFNETCFSYYNSYIQKFPKNIRFSERSDDFQNIINNDIFIIEFNEQAISPESAQFTFVENLLNYINTFME